MPDNLYTDYQIITDHILSKEGQCVLVLGPELSVDINGRGYKSCFKELASIETQDILKYFESENLFYFHDSMGEKRIKIKVKEFYSKVGDPVLLETISRIRLPLIINVCPDIALNNVYTKKGIAFKSGYFSRNQNPADKNLPKPSKEQPVIYNIFGSIDNDASLILTHEKLYETIGSLLHEKALDDNIERFINDASSFIFLGFKFDSWYYQLLCHKLRIKRYPESITSLSAPDCEDNETVKIIMKKSFAMDFTNENPAQVIQRVMEECQKKNIDSLRPKEPNNVYSLYFSYARNNEKKNSTSNFYNREAIVNLIEEQLKIRDKGLINIFRDRNDLTYGDSIDSFMTRIGKGKAVIRVVSDKYLKSRYCMDEALRIQKYKDNDKRVFTVILDDFDSADKLNISYKKYWREECESIFKDIDNNVRDVIDKELLKRNYGVYIDIYNYVDILIYDIKNEVHLRVKPSDIIEKQNGKTEIGQTKQEELYKFIDTIINKMRED